MRVSRTVRWLLFAVLVSVIPASLQAQLLISVSFAPPELPVYEQPMCLEPNLMWVPGYWAYSTDDGDYYWVPGTWAPAPYVGALWTPYYWGWYRGRYRFHRGYWGRHVGYYGGVNYGYGYGGIGFSGGEWRGHEFAYNTAVMHVNESVIHTTYNDRTFVERNTIVNNNRVSYNGGPRGIQHAATREELVAAHDKHTAPTSVQTQHAVAAQTDKTSYAKANGGHPANLVASKPLGGETHAAPTGVSKAAEPAEKTAPKAEAQPHAAPAITNTAAKPLETTAPKAQAKRNAAPVQRPAPAQHVAVAQHTAPVPHAAPMQRAAPVQRTAPVPHAAPVHYAAPVQHAVVQQHAAPQQHSAPPPKGEPRTQGR
ncbi:MAG: hypothetical protein ABSC47_04720 [Terracidiphilus sp.]